MALSVMLLEHMQDRGHAAAIKEEFLRSLMAGTLAAELTPSPREAEESFIGSMFQNLGRMLTEYYFPDEAQQVRQLVKKDRSTKARDKAAVQVLGLTLQELGVGVARSWGLPENLQKVMQQPVGDPPARAEKGLERQRWVGRIANEVSDAMLGEEREPIDQRILRLAEGFAPTLALPPKQVLAAAEAARTRLAALADALGIHVQADAPASRLLAAPPAADPDTLAPHQLAATGFATLEDPTQRVEPRVPVADVLAAGVQDITNSMVADNFKLNEVLRMVLETMFRALSFQRVVFCLRDPRTETLVGRFGLGDRVETLAPVFRIPLKPTGTPDLFSAICAKAMDTLIADATVANIAPRLPAWFRQQVAAPSFLLLPLAMKGNTVALIYADKARAGGIEVQEKELALLRTLRNQAVMAFRQVESR
jgi:eukaryotic-like serine/threonine-protein kinase